MMPASLKAEGRDQASKKRRILVRAWVWGGVRVFITFI
jgi:hypothetical protein